MSYQKNHDLLIQSWTYVLNSYPDWKMEIWGDGSDKDKLQALIKKLGFIDSVKLCGQTSSIQDVYSRASIFALPSRYEGFPLVVSEAMQFGLPCVSFSIHAIENRIIDGQTGYLADNNNRTPKEFANALCKCIESVEQSDILSKNAIKIISQYSIENIMAKWINLFESVAHS